MPRTERLTLGNDPRGHYRKAPMCERGIGCAHIADTLRINLDDGHAGRTIEFATHKPHRVNEEAAARAQWCRLRHRGNEHRVLNRTGAGERLPVIVLTRTWEPTGRVYKHVDVRIRMLPRRLREAKVVAREHSHTGTGDIEGGGSDSGTRLDEERFLKTKSVGEVKFAIRCDHLTRCVNGNESVGGTLILRKLFENTEYNRHAKRAGKIAYTADKRAIERFGLSDKRRIEFRHINHCVLREHNEISPLLGRRARKSLHQIEVIIGVGT